MLRSQERLTRKSAAPRSASASSPSIEGDSVGTTTLGAGVLVAAPPTGVGVLVGVFVGVFVGVAVGVLVGVLVATPAGVLVGVFVGVLVATPAGVLVGVFVGVLVGVGPPTTAKH